MPGTTPRSAWARRTGLSHVLDGRVSTHEGTARLVTRLVTAKDGVVGIEIPAAQNVSTTYQIAAISTGHTGVAGEFVDFVLSAEGHQVLAAAGFSSP